MRNWKKVNRKYVNEGYLYVGFDCLKTWKSELAQMNARKEGARFCYPDSFIRLCSVMKVVFGLGYLQEQGFLESLSRWIPMPCVPSYTQIHRRINRLGLDLIDSLAEPHNGQIIAVDATGIKLYNSGQWVREKHKVRKPFLKLHIAVNTQSKQAVSLCLTDDSVGDNRVGLKLVESAQHVGRVDKVLMDGAYDVRKYWTKLKEADITPVIRLRKNANSNGFGVRARNVRRRNEIGQQAWAKEQGYGQRWQSESWFSAYKRRFGEYVSAKNPETIFQEIILKAILCNKYINSD